MDRENVIKGVHDARRYLEDREWVDKSVGIHIDALNDALVLLKEQEAVQPRRIDGKRNHFIKCGNCNYDLLTSYMFCPHCGKAVKWDA